MRRRLIFADRADAGRQLAQRLAEMTLAEPLVLALPRGGVAVGAEIARVLKASLDVAHVRKIGAPGQPELAVGAVANGNDPVIVLNEELVQALALGEDYITSEAMRELSVIAHRRADYDSSRAAHEPAGRTAILVDDGVATGMTMKAGLQQMRKRGPARLIAATPAASRDALAMLRAEADDVVCLTSPRRFTSVGSFYRVFDQVTDADVTQLLLATNGRQ
jgi:putative phosphoribosyl transferase